MTTLGRRFQETGNRAMLRILQKQRASTALVVLALPAVFLVACYPPMKAPLRVRPVTGPELKSEPDTSLIQPSVTTRAEILRRFAAFDAGWTGKRLFLARWLRSGFVMNGGRNWDGQILAVEFDEKEVVKRYQVLSDNEFLRGEDSFLLTSANTEPGNEQPSRDPSLKSILGYPISAEQIERLSRWAEATVYSPPRRTHVTLGLSFT